MKHHMEWKLLMVQCDLTLILIEALTDDGELSDDPQLEWQRAIQAGCEEPALYPDWHRLVTDTGDNSAEYFAAREVFMRLYKKLRGET